MPDGRTHAGITVAAAIGLYWFGSQAGMTETAWHSMAGGCLSGIFITPDLDVDRPVQSHRAILHRFGPFFAALWRIIWLPYGLAIRHRSWVSHMPIVGTLIRAAYLSFLVSLAAWAAGKLDVVLLPAEALLPLILWAFIGLTVADTLHWLADHLFTAFKRGRSPIKARL